MIPLHYDLRIKTAFDALNGVMICIEQWITEMHGFFSVEYRVHGVSNVFTERYEIKRLKDGCTEKDGWLLEVRLSLLYAFLNRPKFSVLVGLYKFLTKIY